MSTLKFTDSEIKLIISALTYDTQGNWGDNRGEAIEKLLNKIKIAGA